MGRPSKPSKYGLEDMVVGEVRMFTDEPRQLLFAAQNAKRKLGYLYRVNKVESGVKVTRISEDEKPPRNSYAGIFADMPVGGSQIYPVINLAISACEAARNQAPNAKWGTKKTREGFLVFRIA